MPSDVALGCLYSAASAVAYGSFAVPVKSKAVLTAKVHPIVFQLYKSTAALFTALLTLFFVNAVFTPWGLLGAAMWVFTGTVAIIAITHAVFHEEIRDLPLSLVGLLILTLGVAGLGVAAVIGYAPAAEQADVRAPKAGTETEEGIVSPETHAAGSSWPPDEEEERMLQGSSSAMEVEALAGSDASALHPHHAARDSDDSRQLRHFLLGVCCAVVVGVSAGSFLVPFKYAVDVKGLEYILSFGVGAVLSSLVWVAVYFPACWLASRPVPPFHVRIAALPALLAGTLWSLGNLFSILAVDKLGLSIAGPLIQCQLVISNLWAIFYYHEMQRRGAQITVFVSTAVLLLGGFLVAYFGT
ncbi:hypothetical protein WJX73_007506 [Symbiochloris irregularis]|uniref:Uncharacterized protein n=1 Tax=Symbiochloris irregularis TaxID=706552 RepID=A0AAW1NYU9_9CHLO